jgi:hypothetical protein
MRTAAFLILVSALGLLATPHRAWAVLQYNCTSTRCTCIGKSDCKELLGSGWCSGELKCGTDAGLPPDKCRCSVAKIAPKAGTPGLKTKPNIKSY